MKEHRNNPETKSNSRLAFIFFKNSNVIMLRKRRINPIARIKK